VVNDLLVDTDLTASAVVPMPHRFHRAMERFQRRFTRSCSARHNRREYAEGENNTDENEHRKDRQRDAHGGCQSPRVNANRKT
jgi:hypothetical protein